MKVMVPVGFWPPERVAVSVMGWLSVTSGTAWVTMAGTAWLTREVSLASLQRLVTGS